MAKRVRGEHSGTALQASLHPLCAALFQLGMGLSGTIRVSDGVAIGVAKDTAEIGVGAQVSQD